jgi:hypothetical protein
MERFFLAMSQAWDIFDMMDQAFLTDTSPLVVLTVQNGLITEVRPFYRDTAAIAAAGVTG